MNKWEESITNKSDKRKLLIESSEFVSKIKLSKGLKESLSMQAGKAGTLIVKNIPVTILDRENLNGRIYSTETMRQAIEEAREAMADKQTLGQANEHPESSFVAPTDASHVIINAYIKENIAIVVDGKKERHNVLFTDWEVLNTTHGKDLRALFEAECSFGTSIRGVGELSGKMVENYSFISVDGVGNPSSSTYTRMPVSESVKVELKDPNELKENYTVMSSSTNVVRDLSQAGVLQQQLNANPYGTITKTSTKVDQETDPKTGAQTSITTVEADTEDEVNDLNQAFRMAQNAMTNGISKVTSVTIEANEDEDEQGNKKESVDADTGLEAYVPESAPIKEDEDDNIDTRKAEEKRSSDLRSVLNNIDNYLLKIVDSEDRFKYPKAFEIWDEVRRARTLSQPFENMDNNQRISEFKRIIDKANQFISEYKNVKMESAMTESKKEEEPKDPNEGRQYVLKIKDNDPEIKEDADNAPEFVAMKGNAIRFTKDPKKALHFTQGMEESGIVHYSNIQKLLADMGYGEQNLEKWYKKDDCKLKPQEEGIVGGTVGGVAGGALGGAVAGPLGALSGAASGYSLGSNIGDDLSDSNKKEEGTKLTEDGNTKYSAEIKVINKGGLPETKSLAVSATEMNSESLKKELANQWEQQKLSNDVKDVNTLTLVDNQTQERFTFDPKTNQLIPEQNNQQNQQSVEPNVEQPTELEPDTLTPKEESADGEIEQNDNTLAMDIDDNTHVEKQFNTKAQADVAKAGIESGKLSGDVLLSDAVQPGWYVAHDKIGISGPYETREACMEGLEDFAEDVSVYEVTESDLNEVLFNKPSEPSDDYVEKPLDEEEVVYESSLVPVRFSNIKWDEKDAAYRMFEDIEKDMRISHIEPDVNNANILVEYFENYMNDLNNVSVSYDVNPSDIKESVNYQEEIIRLYNEDSSRQYPKIESADINLG